MDLLRKRSDCKQRQERLKEVECCLIASLTNQQLGHQSPLLQIISNYAVPTFTRIVNITGAAWNGWGFTTRPAKLGGKDICVLLHQMHDEWNSHSQIEYENIPTVYATAWHPTLPLYYYRSNDRKICVTDRQNGNRTEWCAERLSAEFYGYQQRIVCTRSGIIYVIFSGAGPCMIARYSSEKCEWTRQVQCNKYIQHIGEALAASDTLLYLNSNEYGPIKINVENEQIIGTVLTEKILPWPDSAWIGESLGLLPNGLLISDTWKQMGALRHHQMIILDPDRPQFAQIIERSNILRIHHMTSIECSRSDPELLLYFTLVGRLFELHLSSDLWMRFQYGEGPAVEIA